MRYYVVDAFTEEQFGGNPAGVCVLDNKISSDLMQKIAAENNLSETAFVVKREVTGEYDLKWFTPKAEIDLCGHATLGTAYVISKFVDVGIEKMAFHTLSGILKVHRKEDLFEMDFPSRMPTQIEITEEFKDVLGVAPIEAYLSRDLLLVMNTEKMVADLSPDFSKMLKLKEGLGVIVTAKGEEVDFVSRCFFPKLGVNEDPVTGSAHSTLIPFWASRLGKTHMIARQLSARGGTLFCKLVEERVEIGGKAVLYSEGVIHIPGES